MKVVLKLFLVSASLVAGWFGARALNPANQTVAVSSADDELAELRRLDAEGRQIQQQVDQLYTRRTISYEAVYGHARCRLGLPLNHPIHWDGTKLEIAPVNTRSK